MPLDIEGTKMDIVLINDEELGSVILDLLPVDGRILAVTDDGHIMEIHLSDLGESAQKAAWDRYWDSFKMYIEHGTYH